MNFISNIFGYLYNIFYDKPNNDINDDIYTIVEQNNQHQEYNPKNEISTEIKTELNSDYESKKINETTYIFINTANIYNASKLMINNLYNSDYANKYIKIYLLKSHVLEPLFKNEIIVNNYNIDYIEYKLSKKRRHLHTFIDAIESFIEFNNIRNYHIYY